jgi:tetratricopeptide (TPR) repeat protein
VLHEINFLAAWPAPGSHQAEKTTMIRAVALATLLGVMVSGLAAYTINSPGSRIVATPLVGGLDRPAETAATTAAWPICTTMASDAPDADWAQLDPDFKAGKKALRAEDWNRAIAAFELAALRDPTNADIQNYIGYAYRRLHQIGPAIGYYQKALMLNPRHRGAHEHLGEAFLVLGDSAEAEQLLAALERLCLIPCEEYDDLKRAITVSKRLATR